MLNARDVLSYVLLRYNVTVKVTTFEEPVLDIIDLMNTTDVLLGMHGAGWTNAIFLKRGAGALQLMPYGWVRPETAKTPRGYEEFEGLPSYAYADPVFNCSA